MGNFGYIDGAFRGKGDKILYRIGSRPVERGVKAFFMIRYKFKVVVVIEVGRDYIHDRVISDRMHDRGDFEDAEAMLGHPYWISGKVIYGRQLGRQLGAPTANIQLHRYRAPIDGVYAVEIDGLDKRYQGVANVGVRPTLNEVTLKPILEVHIFDFAEEIYGRRVKVIFRRKIRQEIKFDGLDALKAAIKQDIENARAWFAEQAA